MTDLVKVYTGDSSGDMKAAVALAEIGKGVSDLRADLARLREQVNRMREPDFSLVPPGWLLPVVPHPVEGW